MPIDLQQLLQTRTRARVTWTDRDAVLYAHGIGLAADPLDEVELRYVRDHEPLTFPTLSAALMLGAGPLSRAGLDLAGVLHGEHRMDFRHPLPSRGEAILEGRVADVWDNGPGKGLTLLEEKRLLRPDDEAALVVGYATVLARRDTGVGTMTEGPRPRPHAVPPRSPDQVVTLATRPDQALLYRLSGDLNPIHVDLDRAREAGFERPILHGLCSFAICARAVIDGFAAQDGSRLRHIEARFRAPVFPGESLVIALWHDGDTISFEAESSGRPVIGAGKALLSAGRAR